MAYDIISAQKAGLSQDQINDYLAHKYNYDIQGAREAGLKEDVILGHLLGKSDVGTRNATPVEYIKNNVVKPIADRISQPVQPPPSLNPRALQQPDFEQGQSPTVQAPSQAVAPVQASGPLTRALTIQRDMKNLEEQGFSGPDFVIPTGMNQQQVMGIANKQGQAQAETFKEEYVNKPAASVVARAARLLSLASFPVASLLDDISGTDEQKARISKNIEELTGFIKDRQAAESVGGVGKFARGAEELVAGIGAMGPAALYEFPAQAFTDTTLDSMDQGIDQETSIKRGLLSSAATTAMMGVPLAGKSIVQGISRGVTFNPALGVSERLADKEILKAGGYDEQAAKIDPLDPQAIGHDALMGIAFSIHQSMQGNKKIPGFTSVKSRDGVSTETKASDVTAPKPWTTGDKVADFVPFGDLAKSSWDVRKINSFFRDELKPVREELAKRGWSRTEINDYIRNRFAQAEKAAKDLVEKWRADNEPKGKQVEAPPPQEGDKPDAKREEGNQETGTTEGDQTGDGNNVENAKDAEVIKEDAETAARRAKLQEEIAKRRAATSTKVTNDTKPGKGSSEAVETGTGSDVATISETLRPAIKTDTGVIAGAEGGTHPDIIKEHGVTEGGTTERGFLTPDNRFLDRSAAKTWMVVNMPDAYDAWEAENGADAPLHSQDMNKAVEATQEPNEQQLNNTIAAAETGIEAIRNKMKTGKIPLAEGNARIKQHTETIAAAKQKLKDLANPPETQTLTITIPAKEGVTYKHESVQGNWPVSQSIIKDGEQIGSFGATHVYGDDESVWYPRITVDKEHQGQGIAKDAYIEILKQIKDHTKGTGFVFAPRGLFDSTTSEDAGRIWNSDSFQTMVNDLGLKAISVEADGRKLSIITDLPEQEAIEKLKAQRTYTVKSLEVAAEPADLTKVNTGGGAHRVERKKKNEMSSVPPSENAVDGPSVAVSTVQDDSEGEVKSADLPKTESAETVTEPSEVAATETNHDILTYINDQTNKKNRTLKVLGEKFGIGKMAQLKDEGMLVHDLADRSGNVHVNVSKSGREYLAKPSVQSASDTVSEDGAVSAKEITFPHPRLEKIHQRLSESGLDINRTISDEIWKLAGDGNKETRRDIAAAITGKKVNKSDSLVQVGNLETLIKNWFAKNGIKQETSAQIRAKKVRTFTLSPEHQKVWEKLTNGMAQQLFDTTGPVAGLETETAKALRAYYETLVDVGVPFEGFSKTVPKEEGHKPETGWLVGEHDGRKFFSNGHFVYEGEKTGRDINVSKVFPESKPAVVQLKPISVTFRLDKSGKFKDGWYQVAMASDDNTQSVYLKYDYFKLGSDKFPTAGWFVSPNYTGAGPVLLRDGDIVKGALMPMREAFNPIRLREEFAPVEPTIDETPEVTEPEPPKNITDELASMSDDDIAAMLDAEFSDEPVKNEIRIGDLARKAENFDAFQESATDAFTESEIAGFLETTGFSDLQSLYDATHKSVAPKPTTTRSTVESGTKNVKSARSIVTKATEEAGEGFAESLKGIAEAFGVDTTKLMHFPTHLDSDAYAKAKPHFEKAWEHYKTSGKSMADFVRFIREQLGKFIDRPAPAPVSGQTLDFMGGQQLYEKIAASKTFKESFKALNDMGKKVYDEGNKTYDSFVKAMKDALKGLWEKFKGEMKRVWDKLKDRKGAVGDLDADLEMRRNKILDRADAALLKRDFEAADKALADYDQFMQLNAERSLPDETTGIKNRMVDAEREAEGKEEAPRMKIADSERSAEGRRMVDSGEHDPRLAAQNIIKNPTRHISAEEQAALLYDKVRIKNAETATRNAIIAAIEKGDDATAFALRQTLRVLADDYDNNQRATKFAGTEASASLRIRIGEMKEDYSIIHTMHRIRGEINIVDPETGKVVVPEELEKKIEELTKQLEEALAREQAYDDKIKELEAQRKIKRVKEDLVPTRRTEKRESNNRPAMDTEFHALANKFKSLAGQLSMNINPEMGVVLAEMARNRVIAGIIDAKDIISDIYNDLKDIPDLDERDIRDAISGYGKTFELSKEEVTASLREAKAQMRLISALEDAQAGELPLHSGMQRDKPTDEVRELQRMIHDAMRETGLDSTSAQSPEQWKTALDAVKSRLHNEISDLDQQISLGKRTVKDRDTFDYDEEAKRLKEIRDEKKALLDEIDAKPPKTEAELEKIYWRMFKSRTGKRIIDMQRRLATGDFSKPVRKTYKPNAEAMRLRNESLKWKELIDNEVYKLQQANRSGLEKTLDAAYKFRRFVLLSGVTTLGKLTIAATGRQFSAVAEEGIASLLAHIPYISRIAAQSPRYAGGMNAKAEAAAITEWFKKRAWQDTWDVAKTGHSELGRLYGEKRDMPPEMIEVFGRWHGALKNMAMRSEFFRSFQKIMEWHIAQGFSATDPATIELVGGLAYIEAQRAILMNDNVAVSAYKAGLRILQNHGALGKVAAGAANIMMTIVKIPTNYFDEGTSYVLGTPKALGAFLFNEGFKRAGKVDPKIADYIMRALVKNGIGVALMLIGYLNSDDIGGYWQPGEKRDHSDVIAGSIRTPQLLQDIPPVPFTHFKLFDRNLPRWALHIPALIPLHVGATIARVQKAYAKKEEKHPEKEYGNATVAGVRTAARGMIEEVPFIAQPLKAFEALKTDESMDKYLRDFADSLVVPPTMRQIAKSMDKAGDEQIPRKVESLLQQLQSSTPGLRDKLDIDQAKVKRMNIDQLAEIMENAPGDVVQEIRPAFRTKLYSGKREISKDDRDRYKQLLKDTEP